MENLSIKQSSTVEIEAAIAQAMGKLTGWENCTVCIQNMQFSDQQLTAGETVGMQIRMEFRPARNDANMPF